MAFATVPTAAFSKHEGSLGKSPLDLSMLQGYLEETIATSGRLCVLRILHLRYFSRSNFEKSIQCGG